ncbi:uncharacterized protein LOC122306522 [Carya illinoinensis]|uniref:uncharacterized protein LOC122306522 n=1 Tax=Carya illinoinensis TaxID=32201 RepID=UPI001C71BEE4|nr:uncharacterized protein LOC122306522 [Carya illinoinensis]
MGDKVGGRDRGEAQMRMFREVVEDGQLFDLGWKGLKYTWSNRHEDSTFTKERIDRAFANSEWKSVYSESNVDVLPATCSDHCPLLLSFHYNRAREGWSLFQFKYDVSWSKEEGYKELIAAQWQKVTRERGKIQNAQHKLEDCSMKLKQWSKSPVHHRNQEIRAKMEEIKRNQQYENPNNMRQLKTLQATLNSLLKQEDLRWKQRAKIH